MDSIFCPLRLMFFATQEVMRMRSQRESDKPQNKFLWEVLPDGSWKGNPCVVIGGGPSLEEFNWSLLKGWLTIGVNRVYEWHDPDIIYSMDKRFFKWTVIEEKYGKQAKEKFLNSKALKVWRWTPGRVFPSYIHIVKDFKNYSKAYYAVSPSLKLGIGHGNNSGYGAMNIAVCLGANPIYLLGFDMKESDGKRHFHDGHPKKQPAKVLDNFRASFRKAKPQLEKIGIEVINVVVRNPDQTALKAYPIKTAEEVFK